MFNDDVREPGTGEDDWRTHLVRRPSDPAQDHSMAIEYLARFFGTHCDRYFDDMLEALQLYGSMGRYDDVLDGIRDIVHNISDTFLDPRSPSYCRSPMAADGHLNSFVAFLNRQQSMIDLLVHHHAGRGEQPPRPVELLQSMNREVSYAVRYARTLGDPPAFRTPDAAAAVHRPESA